MDVVVELSPDAPSGLDALEALAQDLEQKLGRDVDVVLEANLHPAMRHLIDKEAVVI